MKNKDQENYSTVQDACLSVIRKNPHLYSKAMLTSLPEEILSLGINEANIIDVSIKVERVIVKEELKFLKKEAEDKRVLTFFEKHLKGRYPPVPQERRGSISNELNNFFKKHQEGRSPQIPDKVKAQVLIILFLADVVECIRSSPDNILLR